MCAKSQCCEHLTKMCTKLKMKAKKKKKKDVYGSKDVCKLHCCGRLRNLCTQIHVVCHVTYGPSYISVYES